MQKLKSKKTIIILIIGTILLTLFIWGMIALLPYMKMLKDPIHQQNFKNYINSLGVWGIILMIFIQFTQVVIAIIPGEPIEVLAGVMYGPIYGTLLCLLGTVLGGIFIFWLIRSIGPKIIYKFFGKDKVHEYRFLKNRKKVLTLTFILYLIPGTPKDILNYIAPISKIKLWEFILISTFARIPSVASSTIAGSTISTGNISTTIIIFACTLTLGLLGIYIGSRFNKKCQDEYDLENESKTKNDD